MPPNSSTRPGERHEVAEADEAPSPRAQGDRQPQTRAQGAAFGAKPQTANVPAIDVAVCDKSPLILAGLDKLLTDDRRFNLVLKVTDGEEFLDAARQPRFTLAVIGWQLPTLHARDVLRALSRQALGAQDRRLQRHQRSGRAGRDAATGRSRLRQQTRAA